MAGSAGETWRPAAGRAMLEGRAEMLARIRHFFSRRGVLEVETPILSAAANPDPGAESYRVEGSPPRYLHTSPEFAMKRLLAAGSGPIYQLSRVFRAGERSRQHNPEFTLLEWYRPGFDLGAVMEETLALVAACLPGPLPEPLDLTWRQAFRRYAGLDPDESPPAEIRAAGEGFGDAGEDWDRDQWLDLIFARGVAPALPRDRPVLMTGFPASQAALARADGEARRFELFLGGLELANGYEELTDPVELRARFDAWNRARTARGGAPLPLDENLLAAMETGLPDSCGVALGVDRLLMVRTGAERIDEVLAFPVERA